MNKLSLQERVRHRLRQYVSDGNVSHEVIAKYLGVSRSHFTRLLNEDGAILLSHIEKLCEFFQITASELMAEPGAVIQPLSPLEAGIVDRFRKMTELERHSWMVVLDKREAEEPRKRRRARLGRAELSEEQQLLVDLFARVKRDGVREGVLQTLRGAVKDDAPIQSHVKPRTTG